MLTMTDEIKLQFCSKCGCTKVQEQYFTINKKGQYMKTCNDCRERQKLWQEKNKEKIKQYAETNKDKKKEYDKQYHKQYNADKRHHCEHNKEKQRCKICDPQGHLKYVVSSRIRAALKSDKTDRSIEYLGCTIQEFREHIESQFTEGMSWKNHGTWQIDHRIPVKYKQDGIDPTIEEVGRRLHYLNCQPMWAAENIAKGNRFIG